MEELKRKGQQQGVQRGSEGEQASLLGGAASQAHWGDKVGISQAPSLTRLGRALTVFWKARKGRL